MLHVFVDTNVFLSLYAYADDNIEELRKILKLIKGKELRLYISSIVNQEFYRNRDRKIIESVGNLERFSTTLSFPRFVEHHPEYKELRALLKQVDEKRTALVDRAKAEIRSMQLGADQLFAELRTAQALIPISDEMDKAARRRMERRNPPGKDGDLGDRFNWEMLLAEVPEKSDIHVLSRDKDYGSPLGPDVPNSFLAQEWAAFKGGMMYLYPGMKPFVKAHFPDISLASDVEKKLAIKALLQSGSWQQTHAAIAQLAPFTADLTGDEAKELFEALLANPEINIISSDSDVEDFYKALLKNHWEVLSSEQYQEVTTYIDDDVPF